MSRLAFSPDGRSLVSAAGKDLKLWELATMAERATLRGHTDLTKVVAFSPDGGTLVSAGEDGKVRVWDVATGKERVALDGPKGGPDAVAFSPDGKTLAVGGLGGQVVLWDVPDPPAAESVPWDDQEAEAAWDDLGSDAARAYKAMGKLAASGRAAALLRPRLKPIAAADPAKVAALVKGLDAEGFATRQKAGEELERMGEAAAAALRRALDQEVSAEAEARVKVLLGRLESTKLRDLRALEVLERDGGREAREVLRALAGGAAEARLTGEAKGSLERLGLREKSGR
jgi:hypothetical protein